MCPEILSPGHITLGLFRRTVHGLIEVAYWTKSDPGCHLAVKPAFRNGMEQITSQATKDADCRYEIKGLSNLRNFSTTLERPLPGILLHGQGAQLSSLRWLNAGATSMEYSRRVASASSTLLGIMLERAAIHSR